MRDEMRVMIKVVEEEREQEQEKKKKMKKGIDARENNGLEVDKRGKKKIEGVEVEWELEVGR